MHEPTTRDSALRRKLVPRPALAAFGLDFDAGVPAPPPTTEAAGGRGPARAFGRAVSRATGLVAQGHTQGQRSAGLAELLDLPDPLGFAALLSDGAGPHGLVLVDPAGVGALIEALTIGAFARKPLAPRRPTATDAALIGDLIDAVLQEIDTRPDPAEPLAPGYRLHQPVAELRLLGLLLDDGEFTLDRVEFDLMAGETGRKGVLTLALPRTAPAFDPFVLAGTDPDEVSVVDDAADDWQRAIETSVLGAPAELHAVLGRIRLPLAEALELGVDSRLAMPLSNLEEVQLESLDHRLLALGRLGQYRAMRALRLTALDDAAPGPATDPPAPSLEPPGT